MEADGRHTKWEGKNVIRSVWSIPSASVGFGRVGISGSQRDETLTRTLLHAVAERDLVFDPKTPTRQDVEHIHQANVLLRHIIEDIAA